MEARMKNSRTGRGLVVLCSHGIMDPLVAPLMLDYLLRLQACDEGRKVLLVTEEREILPLPGDLAARLGALGIEWMPLVYRMEGAQWPQKLRNLLRVWKQARSFLRGCRDRQILGYLAFAGSYATILGILGLGRTVTLCFEPHSLYMAEMGIWRTRGVKYRLVRFLEVLQMRRQDVLIVPTQAVKDHAIGHGRRRPCHLQGITIDVAAAAHDPSARDELRTRYGLHGSTVLAYVGKFGGIYHDLEAYGAFMLRMADVEPLMKFLVITQAEWCGRMEALSDLDRIRDRILAIPPVPPVELPRWLSAADFGVIAVPPTPSQAFRTPVKSAYYWAAGLPIIIPRGVSDDHVVADLEDVGVVVDDLPTVDATALALACARYRSMDPMLLRQRCSQVAMKYRDTSRMVSLLKEVLG
jgi:glycosyltransferase involved in cell wall biosynthesis